MSLSQTRRHTQNKPPRWYARPFLTRPTEKTPDRNIKGFGVLTKSPSHDLISPISSLKGPRYTDFSHHAGSLLNPRRAGPHGHGPTPCPTQPKRRPYTGNNARYHGCLCGCYRITLESAIPSLLTMALQGKQDSCPRTVTQLTKQMLVIAFHEFGHAITACCTGGRVESISLDPHEGGVTHMRGGMSAITLPAGYLGSSIIGALLIFAGFDIVASKVASFVLGVCFLLTLWWARKDWLTIGTILLAIGLLVACWFIAHAEALRWFVVSWADSRKPSFPILTIIFSFSSVSCLLSTACGILYVYAPLF